MGAVADPVHEGQDAASDTAVAQVILHDDRVPRNTDGFLQQTGGIIRVVQYIHENDRIHAVVFKGISPSIIRLHRNCTTGPLQDIYTLNIELRMCIHYQSGDYAVATTDIKDCAFFRQ
jgi:hypothetical protein